MTQLLRSPILWSEMILTLLYTIAKLLCASNHVLLVLLILRVITKTYIFPLRGECMVIPAIMWIFYVPWRSLIWSASLKESYSQDVKCHYVKCISWVYSRFKTLIGIPKKANLLGQVGSVVSFPAFHLYGPRF